MACVVMIWHEILNLYNRFENLTFKTEAGEMISVIGMGTQQSTNWTSVTSIKSNGGRNNILLAKVSHRQGVGMGGGKAQGQGQGQGQREREEWPGTNVRHVFCTRVCTLM